MSRTLRILLGLAFVFGSLVATLAISFASEPTPIAQNDQFSERVFLPAVGSSRLSTQALELASDAGWQTFESSYWHLSFQYPSDWTITESDPARFRQPGDATGVRKGIGYRVQLFSPAQQPGDSIEIAYALIEKPVGQSLADWVTKKVYLESVHMEVPRIVTDTHSIALQDELGKTQDIIIGTVETVIGDTTYRTRVAWILHGALVYYLGTLDEKRFAVIEDIACSFRFAEGAPESLDQLHGESLGDVRKTVEEELEFWDRPPVTDYCDVACRDRKRAEELGYITPVPTLEPINTPIPIVSDSESDRSESQGPSSDSGIYAAATPPATPTVPAVRLALPADWFIPTRANVEVWCGSEKHIDNAAFALDIQVSTGHDVFAAKEGTVIGVGNDGPAPSYGLFIVISTPVNIADEQRQYVHGYAHLSAQDVGINDTVGAGNVIGASGCTGVIGCCPSAGGCGQHLHFHVSRLDGARGAVDLTPMVGFTPNMHYPNHWETCGYVVNQIPPGNYPLILESVAFSERSSGNSHDWLCYTGGHTTECRLIASPDNGAVWNPSLSTSNFSNTAHAKYGNVFVPAVGTYYVWVCGNGAPGKGMVHSAADNFLTPTSARLKGFTTSWSWKSVTVTDARPYVYLFSSIVGSSLIDRTINMLMYEDGFMYDRVLLTRDQNYDPNGNIRCGGGY